MSTTSQDAPEILGSPHERLHLDEVDYSGEFGLGANRELDHCSGGPEALADGVEAEVEVGASAVHLVDESDARNVVPIGLTPDRLRLRLDAGDAVEHGDCTVEHTQRTFDLDGEVDVAGCVDDVDVVITPGAVGGGGGDGDAALLLLFHPVHRGGAIVDLADLVVDAGVVEDPFCRRGLARVDVGHDPYVAGVFEWMS